MVSKNCLILVGFLKKILDNLKKDLLGTLDLCRTILIKPLRKGPTLKKVYDSLVGK